MESASAEAANENCPECDSESQMQPIKLFDQLCMGAIAQELGYSTPDAKPDWITGDVPEAGKVSAKMCPQCGRIILRAVRHKNPQR